MHSGSAVRAALAAIGCGLFGPAMRHSTPIALAQAAGAPGGGADRAVPPPPPARDPCVV